MTYKDKVKEHVNNDEIFNNLVKYVQMIEEKNKVMNLTGFKDDRLWQEGIYESIVSLESTFKNVEGKELLDIGAGAGFPSIPFKITHPLVNLSIYEGQNKRVKFLTEVSEELNLNIRVLNQRVETSDEIEYFDLITARAVSELKVLIEASALVGKINSKYAFVKGPRVNEEKQRAGLITKDLGVKVEINKVPFEGKEIFIASYYKIQATPKGIPREWSKIVKK